jgi:hypothetical protein
MYTRKSKNKDQHAKNIFQPFFLTFSPILSIISPFYNKYDGVLKGGGPVWGHFVKSRVE